MKKIYIISLICVVFIILIMTGCAFRTNYIKKYNDELHTIFGNFSYDYLGKAHEHGYEGLGSYNYKKWGIHFIDSYGKEETAILTNDAKIDYQIYQIYEYYVQRRLTTEILAEYFNYYFDENTISSEWLDDSYKTKKYNYRIDIYFDFDLTDYYDSKDEKIKDYKFFDLTNTNINDLIEKEIVSISKIQYVPLDEKILNESELNLELNYLTKITKQINNVVPIKTAIYWIYENKTDHEGKSYIRITTNELNFKE